LKVAKIDSDGRLKLYLKPTYEGLKVFSSGYKVKEFLHLKPTYEGLKVEIGNYTIPRIIYLKPTYEGLKA